MKRSRASLLYEVHRKRQGRHRRGGGIGALPGPCRGPDPAGLPHARRPARRRGCGPGRLLGAVPGLGPAGRTGARAGLRSDIGAERLPVGAPPSRRRAPGDAVGVPAARHLGRSRGDRQRGTPGSDAGGQPAAWPAARGAGAPLLSRPARAGDRAHHGAASQLRQIRHAPCPQDARPVDRGEAMTALEDKLRAAIHATASQLPADPPPLRLSPRSSEKPSARRHWIAWTAPLASGALVVAVIAGSLALTSGGKPPQAGPKQASISQASVPPYYVALVTGRGEPDEDDSPGTAAQVRATLTGAVLATIAVPKPYVTFSAVKGAADDRTFVLAAQGTTHPALTQQELSREYPQGYVPPTRFYVLRIDPASATPSGRVSLQALPAGLVPAKTQLDDMALSPDGTLLAADIGGFLLGPVGSHLYVFNLATGTKRSWSYRICSRCLPAGGGLGFGGVNVDALSWTAD